jgi:hypothetical protein
MDVSKSNVGRKTGEHTVIYIENNSQIKWENFINRMFGVFPVNLTNTGNLSIDQAIGFMQEQQYGFDTYADIRMTKGEEFFGIDNTGRGNIIRDSEYMSYLLLKYGMINIAPENRQQYWSTPEGKEVFRSITSELANRMLVSLEL